MAILSHAARSRHRTVVSRRPDLRALRLLACVAWLLCLTPGCRLIDPLVAAGNYEVKAAGGSTVRVRLKGGDGVSRVRQRDVIQDLMLDISKDNSLDSAAFDAMLELESLFEQNGYALAQVHHRVDRRDRLTIRFDIQQGPLVRVAKLRIVGNPSVSYRTLAAYWSRRRTEALGLGDDLYVASDLETLARTIAAHYQRNGFLDATATLEPPEPALSPATTQVTVTVRVSEGIPYKLGRLETEREITAALGQDAPKAPREGAAYSPQAVQDHALALAQHLRRRGHPDPLVLVTTTPNPANHTVAVRLHGKAGDVVDVGRVIVRGNKFVTEANIRKRITVRPGVRFDGKTEQDSLLRLYQSGLFRRVDVRHEKVGPNRIDVVFAVEETTRYLLQPMLGYGSYEELRGGLEFGMLSVLGTGFDFSAKGTLSNKGHRLVVNLSDSQFLPEWLGYDTTFSVTADTFRREEPSYVDGANGISPSLAHLFSREFSGRVAYIYREHGDANSDVIDPGAQIGDYTEGSALIELTYDSRDNPLIPKRGTRLSAQYKYYDESLGGDVSLAKLRLTGTTVLSLSRSTRLVLHGEVGLLYPGEGSDAVPIQERWFNGGENVVRSFREDQLAPPDLKDINGQPIGGEYRNILNAELRWAPHWRLLRAFDVELATFVDAGNVGRSVQDYGLGDRKYGIGFGLRFLLPIGPVRFDSAWNPDRDPGERNWTIHFSIGYPF
ncbi:MAG: BamA/TamA family outer membrane protein [Planctomycetes bacterium]|nr:BamA/TamA family outer membrane protein [Planctomycetota bacterium]